MKRQFDTGKLLAASGVSRVEGALFLCSTHPSEVYLAVLQVGLFLYFANPFTDVTAVNASYQAARDLAPEWVWTILLGLVCLLYVLGWWLRSVPIARYAAAGSWLTWTFVGVMIHLSRPESSAIATFLPTALLSAWVYWRHSAILRSRREHHDAPPTS